MHSLGEYNKLDQNKLENIYLLFKGWWREKRTKRNRDDVLSKEEEWLSKEQDGISKEEDGLSKEQDGMSKVENGLSKEEDGLSKKRMD